MSTLRYYARRWRNMLLVSQSIEHFIFQSLMAIMLFVHTGLGSAIIFGGVQRFTYPTYEPLVNLTHGNVWFWGVTIFSSAALMAIPLKWLNILGIWIGLMWNIVWMACFAVATNTYPDAAATPSVAYAGFALINFVLLIARVLERPRT